MSVSLLLIFLSRRIRLQSKAIQYVLRPIEQSILSGIHIHPFFNTSKTRRCSYWINQLAVTWSWLGPLKWRTRSCQSTTQKQGVKKATFTTLATSLILAARRALTKAMTGRLTMHGSIEKILYKRMRITMLHRHPHKQHKALAQAYLRVSLI